MTESREANATRISAAGEAELIARAQNGDRDAMEAILRAYQHRVFSICLRMLGYAEDAADLTQDTLTKLLMNIDRYDGRAALSTWVYRIAVNACLSHRRKRRTIERHEASESRLGSPLTAGSSAERDSGTEPSVSDRVQHDEWRRAALESLRRIPDDARALLILRDVRGLEYQQIAQVLEVPVGTIKSRLFRARLLLRGEMERTGVGNERPEADDEPLSTPEKGVGRSQ